MHTVFALLCFVVVIHWLIFPYPPGLLRWHCGNLTIAPVPAKQPWWIWINTSCEIIMNDYITTTKQSTTKPCAYLLGYTVSLPLQAFPVGSVGLRPSAKQSIPIISLPVFVGRSLPRALLGLSFCFTWSCHLSRGVPFPDRQAASSSWDLAKWPGPWWWQRTLSGS